MMIRALLSMLLVWQCISAQADGATPPAKLKHFKDCDVCSEMIVVPGGSFQMGATDADLTMEKVDHTSPLARFLIWFGSGRESPQITMKVKTFALAKYDVTRAQFAVFAHETHFEEKGCLSLDPKGDSPDADWQNLWFKQTDQDPVVCVSWDDAEKFIAWLNAKLPPNEAHYRLPTEAEWEYAARAGTITPTYWGGTDFSEQCRFANVRDEAGINSPAAMIAPHKDYAHCNDGYAMTSPIGFFPPNPWGFYDMLGNVEQWMLGCNGALGDSGSLAKISYCKRRAVRGSAWYFSPSAVRAATRSNAAQNDHAAGIGFRLARDVGQ